MTHQFSGKARDFAVRSPQKRLRPTWFISSGAHKLGGFRDDSALLEMEAAPLLAAWLLGSPTGGRSSVAAGGV